jgi:hypothetical protein
VSPILEPVTDDRRVVLGERGHRYQFGLAAGFETVPVLPAEVEHFLHDLPLLIHLDRVDAAVSPLVLVLCDCPLKRGVNVGQPVFEDVGEAEEDRCAQTAMLEAIDQALEIDPSSGILCGMHLQVPLIVDGEVALTPACDIVKLSSLCQRPRCTHRPIAESGNTTHLQITE